MDLKINNRLINSPIKEILTQLKKELNNYLLKDIIDKGDDIIISCPHHKNGMENKPSCFVYTRDDNPKVEKGFCHCFTCDYKAPLYKLVADCFEKNNDFGKQWLLDRYGDTFVEQFDILPEIELEKKDNNILDNSILQKYAFYHPYMWYRKLSVEVVDKFEVGYDEETKCLTFPVRDEYDNLVMITKRSVEGKNFYIEKDKEKPLYLLNTVRKEHIDSIIICEGQIDALTAWTYGFPAVATMGNISQHQIDLINNSGIRVLYTMFDNDNAGQKFTNTLTKKLKKDILLNKIHINIPNKKDINDLTKEEFYKCINDSLNYSIL